MSDHRRLQVWHRANALSTAAHHAVGRHVWRGAPGLKSQLLRCVSSIPANLAEGAGQASRLQFAHFVSISIGSANEAETHLILARSLGLIAARVAAALLGELDQVRRMLFGLRKFLLQDARA